MNNYESIIHDFARNQNTSTKRKGNEVSFERCPYCHGGDHNDKHSFYINVDSGQFECKRSSCGVKGNLFTLSNDFRFDLPEEMKSNNHTPQPKQYKTPSQELNSSTNEAYEYFKNRGISKEVVDKYKITTQKEKPNILVMPFIDDKGKVVSIKYRRADFDKTRNKSKEWSEANCKPILYGMNQADTSQNDLIICEGMIDCLSICQSGFSNVVSVPSGANSFNDDCFNNSKDFLSQFKRIIVFGDYERGIITLLDDVRKRFKGQVLNVRPKDYKDLKDANDLLTSYGVDAVKYAIEHAELSRVSDCLMSLSEVTQKEYKEDDFIKTGIAELDKALGGGFYKGEVVLLTGKSGHGKTTFSSQLIANMIDKGKRALIYSGELEPSMSKRWLDLQLSGSDNIVISEDEFDFKNYIEKEAEQKISKWYRDKVFIVDSFKNAQKENPMNIFDLIRRGAIQYEAEFVVVDNLMSAMESNIGDDLYNEQSRFVGQLCSLASELNIVLMLIGHKRKNASGTIDDISGSADIVNKSSIVLQYEKPTERDYKGDDLKTFIDEKSRILKVIKNRHNGRTTPENKGFIMRFEDASKRIEPMKLISSKGETRIDMNSMFKYRYAWNYIKESNGQKTIDDIESEV